MLDIMEVRNDETGNRMLVQVGSVGMKVIFDRPDKPSCRWNIRAYPGMVVVALQEGTEFSHNSYHDNAQLIITQESGKTKLTWSGDRADEHIEIFLNEDETESIADFMFIFWTE